MGGTAAVSRDIYGNDFCTFFKLIFLIFYFFKKGGNGLVCVEGDRTCCPSNVESSLRHSAASDFHHAVRQSSHQLRHTLTQSSTAIQGKFCFLFLKFYIFTHENGRKCLPFLAGGGDHQMATDSRRSIDTSS